MKELPNPTFPLSPVALPRGSLHRTDQSAAGAGVMKHAMKPDYWLRAKRALARRTGARGLRSIMEGILLDTMFDLPGFSGVEEVVISAEVAEGKAQPLYIYSERRGDLETSA